MALHLVLGATASTLAPPRARVAPRHAPACANAAGSSGSGSGVDWPSAPAENIELAETYYRAFEVLARDADFVADVWARKPLLVAEPIAGVAGSFTLDDVREAVDSDFLEAGLGVPTAEGGWKMAPVSQPRGSSYEDAKLRYVDVAAGIERGTVVFNSAGAHVPKLGAICLAALRAFGLPNCLNMYLTGPSVKQSAPPHTDKQDVFVLQMSGAKQPAAASRARRRRRAGAPPDRRKALAGVRAAAAVPPTRLGPSRAWKGRRQAPPLGAGHELLVHCSWAGGRIGDDKLRLSELGEPLLETVLTPGQPLCDARPPSAVRC